MGNRLSISESSRRSGYDKQTIRKLCKTGLIAYSKTPENFFEVDEASLIAYCDRQNREYQHPTPQAA